MSSNIEIDRIDFLALYGNIKQEISLTELNEILKMLHEERKENRKKMKNPDSMSFTKEETSRYYDKFEDSNSI